MGSIAGPANNADLGVLDLIHKIRTGSFGSMELEREVIAKVIKLIVAPMVEDDVFPPAEEEDLRVALTHLETGTFTAQLQRELIASIFIKIVNRLQDMPSGPNPPDPDTPVL